MTRSVWVGLLAALSVVPFSLMAQDPFVGNFEGDGVILILTGSGGTYSGSLTFQGYKMPARVKGAGGKAIGEFDVNGQTLQTYKFALVAEGGGYKLTSDGKDYHLVRHAPAVPAQAKAPTESIVGNWRSGKRTARFNPGGTGVIDGVDGRYEIKGNQLTLIGPQTRMTVTYGLDGDILTMTPAAGGTVTWNRVKE